MPSLLFRVRVLSRQRLIKHGLAMAMLGFVLLGLIMALLWYPLKSTHTRLQHDEQQLRHRLIELNQLMQLKDQIQIMDDRVKGVELRLASRRSQADLSRDLYQLAATSKVTVISNISLAPQVKQGYVIQQQELSLQGDYLSLRKFISGVGQLPQWTLTKELSIKRKQGANKLLAELVLVSYVRQAGL